MYESKTQPLITRFAFYRRLLLHVAAALVLVGVTLAMGMLAHIWFEELRWFDALLNTALIVSGIGPYIMPTSVGGKIFLAMFSTWVGLVFIATLGLLLAPIVHRIIHKFHLDED